MLAKMLPHVIEGDGPVVVLLHGFGLDGRMWAPQVAALRARFRLVTIDLPGFGPAPVDVGEATAAAAVAAVIEAVADAPVHVVGHSLGATVAIDLALTAPARVRSLTLIGPLMRRRPSGIVAWDRTVALAKAGDLAAARAAWMGDAMLAGASGAVRDAVRAMVDDYRGDHWCERAITRYAVADPAARLGEVAVPTLVIIGERDLATFRANADEYAAKVPGAVRAVVGGAGHLVSLERPDEVSGLIRRFLEAARPPSS
jgi:pimeloyl-ACP methyl ester carboxylesterase